MSASREVGEIIGETLVDVVVIVAIGGTAYIGYKVVAKQVAKVMVRRKLKGANQGQPAPEE